MKAMSKTRTAPFGPISWSMRGCCWNRKRTPLVAAGGPVQRGPQGTFAYVVKADKTRKFVPSRGAAQGNLKFDCGKDCRGPIVVTDGSGQDSRAEA